MDDEELEVELEDDTGLTPTQYGQFISKNESKQKAQGMANHKPYSNRFSLVLDYWLRNDELTNYKDFDVQNIFAVIVKYCGANRLWIVFPGSGIVYWTLSSSNPVKPRLSIGLEGTEPQARYSRYHIDSATNAIYAFHHCNNTLARGNTELGNEIVKAHIVKDGPDIQDIQWETLGKLPRDPFDYRKIRVFNDERILCTESTLMIADAWGAHAQRNCQILDFDLKQNALTKPILYRKYSNNSILDAMEQINQESLLCCSGHSKSVFLVFPNKQKDDRFTTLKYDEQWQLYHNEFSYCSGYHPLNANNVYCGQGTGLKHYNLVKDTWFDCRASHFEHTNYSRPDMIGYNIVTTKWMNDDPNLLYVGSMNRNDPHSQFTLHQDDVTNNDNVVDGAIVHYVMKQPLNEELYDIRCNQWLKLDASSIELGPLKWAKFIEEPDNWDCPVYPVGDGCTDQNCIVHLGRQLLYFD